MYTAILEALHAPQIPSACDATVGSAKARTVLLLLLLLLLLLFCFGCCVVSYK